MRPPTPADQLGRGDPPGLHVGPASRQLRRALGAMAWAVLEEVVLDARPTGSDLVAQTNVRRLAASLGISKDTAARAVARLSDAGLLRRQDAHRQSGRFMASTYVVRLGEASGITPLAGGSCPMGPRPVAADTAVPCDADASSSPARGSSPPRSFRRRRASTEQASLFPVAGQLEDAQ